MHCPQTNSEKKRNDTKFDTKCHFSDKCFYCGKVSYRINECHNKRAVEEKAKVAIDKEKEQENEKVKLVFHSTSQSDMTIYLQSTGLGTPEHPITSLIMMMACLMSKKCMKHCMKAQEQ